MNVRVARRHVQMTVRVAAKRIASRPARQIVRRLAQTVQTNVEALALQHVQMTVQVAAKIIVPDAATAVRTIVRDSIMFDIMHRMLWLQFVRKFMRIRMHIFMYGRMRGIVLK